MLLVRSTARPSVWALILLSVALLCPPAQARSKRLPAGFFGTVVDPNVTEPLYVAPKTFTAEFKRMRSSGVESARVTFSWAKINVAKGRYDWSSSDRIVKAAATNHVALLPIVMFTPAWASRSSKKYLGSNAPPAKYSSYATFMTALVKRYGPKGSFFHGHGVRKAPIRQWQVWNEPMQRYFWQTSGKWWTTYGPMLKAAHHAVHKVDKKAVVVTAGLSGSSAGPSWEDLGHLYGAAGRSSFDAVAINQYTNAEGSTYTTGKPTGVKSSVDHLFQVGWFVRNVMDRHHDRKRKPIYLTEFGWPAAYGDLPKGQYKGLESTPSGAAKRMTSFIARLAGNGRYPHPYGGRFPARRSRALGITRAYWYTWASSFTADKQPKTFDFSGLNQWTPTKPFKATPLLATFEKNAKKY